MGRGLIINLPQAEGIKVTVILNLYQLLFCF